MSDIDLELRNAVEENDFERVKRLLKDKANPNYKIPHLPTEYSGTTFHLAVWKSSIDIIRILLENGADPNVSDHQKVTPFFSAVWNTEHNQVLTQLFLEHGADINSVNGIGMTPLPYIIRDKILPFDYLATLLKDVKDPRQKSFNGGNILHFLVDVHPDEDDGEMGEIHFCQNFISIISEKHKKLFPDLVLEKDRDGDTPLHLIASAACAQSIELLISFGAKVNVKNNLGQTPLHLLVASADYEGFSESLQLLLESSANINEKDNAGKTPLHYALSSEDSNDVSVVEVLVAHGATLTSIDAYGRNLLHSVVNKTTCEEDLVVNYIDILVKGGVNVNQKDIFSQTPLHLAVMRKNLNVVLALISNGADITLPSKTGESSLHRACLRYAIGPSVIERCKASSIDLNIGDKFGSTPLHWAIWFREQVVIKSLLSHDADINRTDAPGISSRNYAKLLHYEHIEYLLGTKSPESSLSMVIEGNEIDFHGTDMLEECPTLSYIDKENFEIDTSDWSEHLLRHKTGICEFMATILDSPSMGLYYDFAENKTICDVITKVMNDLASYVSFVDPVLSCDVKLTGSRREMTKVGLPDEFDFVWTLQKFKGAFIPVDAHDESPESVKLKVKNERKTPLTRFVDDDGFLSSTVLNRSLYTIVNEGLIKYFSDQSNIHLQNLYVEEPLDVLQGGLSSITFIWIGPLVKCLSISVDIVPEVYIDNWLPNGIDTSSIVFAALPDKTKRSISVIMKTPDSNFVLNNHRLFRLSFADWEYEAMLKCPRAVLKGYILVKAILGSHFFPTIIDTDNSDVMLEILTTYKIKNCFFLELEEAYKSNDEILNIPYDCINKCVSLEWANRIITRLEKAIKDERLSSLFFPRKNLLLIEGSDVVYSLLEYRTLCGCLKEIFTLGTL